jgi:hypothetical protein
VKEEVTRVPQDFGDELVEILQDLDAEHPALDRSLMFTVLDHVEDAFDPSLDRQRHGHALAAVFTYGVLAGHEHARRGYTLD